MTKICDPLAGWCGIGHIWYLLRGAEDASVDVELIDVSTTQAHVRICCSFRYPEEVIMSDGHTKGFWEGDSTTPHWIVECRGVDKSHALANIKICYSEAEEPIPCSDHTTQATCEAAGCYWHGGACHSTPENGEEPPEGTTEIGMDRTVYIAGIGFDMSELNCKAGTAVVEAVGTGIKRLLVLGGAAAKFPIVGYGATIIYMAAAWVDDACTKMAVRYVNVPPELPGSEGATDGAGNMKSETDPDNPLNPDNPDNPDKEGSTNHPDNPDNDPDNPDNAPGKGVQPEGALVRRKRDEWDTWFGVPFPYGEGEDEHNYTDLMRRDLQIYNCIIFDKCSDLKNVIKSPGLVEKLKAWYKDLLDGVAAGELTKEEFYIALNRGIVSFSNESFILAAFTLSIPTLLVAGETTASGTTPQPNQQLEICATKKFFGFDFLAADDVLATVASDSEYKYEATLNLDEFGIIEVYARIPKAWWAVLDKDITTAKHTVFVLTWEVVMFLIIAAALIYDKKTGKLGLLKKRR